MFFSLKTRLNLNQNIICSNIDLQENGYEGDEENSTGSSTSSIGSPYDFEDEPMSEDTMSTSSTITGRNTKKSKKTSGKKQSQQKNKKLKNLTPESGNHSKQIPACEKEKSSKVKSVKKSPSISASEKTKNKSVTFQNISDAEEKLKFPKTPVPKSPIVALEKLDLQMVEESQRQLRKRKSETVVTQNPKVTKKDLKDNCKIDKKVNNTSIHGRIVPEMVQDMSTPNEILRTKTLRKSGNDSCFGFEDIRRTSLPVSPVCKLPITPLSDYASMDTFSHDVTMEDSSQKSKPSSPTLFSMDEDGNCTLYLQLSQLLFWLAQGRLAL